MADEEKQVEEIKYSLDYNERSEQEIQQAESYIKTIISFVERVQNVAKKEQIEINRDTLITRLTIPLLIPSADFYIQGDNGLQTNPEILNLGELYLQNDLDGAFSAISKICNNESVNFVKDLIGKLVDEEKDLGQLDTQKLLDLKLDFIPTITGEGILSHEQVNIFHSIEGGQKEEMHYQSKNRPSDLISLLAGQENSIVVAMASAQIRSFTGINSAIRFMSGYAPGFALALDINLNHKIVNPNSSSRNHVLKNAAQINRFASSLLYDKETKRQYSIAGNQVTLTMEDKPFVDEGANLVVGMVKISPARLAVEAFGRAFMLTPENEIYLLNGETPSLYVCEFNNNVIRAQDEM